MLEKSRIVYLFVYVSDLARSRAFYADTLGLRVLEEDPAAVKFDCGHVILTLNRAADYGIGLPKTSDGCADIVFLVDDLVATRTALEANGVKFNNTMWYQPGGLVDFYDPDSHWLTLYQPSSEAMSWPSGDRIRAVLKARKERPQFHPDQPADGPVVEGALFGADLIYTFFFVYDPGKAVQFYHHALGIQDLEGGPCSQLSSGDEDGVIKYDTGGMILTTHFIDESRTAQQVLEHTCPPRELDPDAMKSVAPAFHVENIDSVVQSLTNGNGLRPNVTRSSIGAVASLEDPSGHLIFLYEPSDEALRSPSGSKIREILGAPL